MALLVLPVVCPTFVCLAKYGWGNKRFKEILPLLLVQLNAIFVWTCLAIVSAEYRPPQSTHLKSRTASNFLAYTYFLLPINTFVYSWRFLESLGREQQK